MSKDQNPSDKACDAYFDNPCAATSGSYYSDRVTFYAGFAAGAASRDAEVAELQKSIDDNWVTHQQIVSANKERDQLREQVKTLQSAIKNLRDVKGRHHSEIAYKRLIEALTATE